MKRQNSGRVGTVPVSGFFWIVLLCLGLSPAFAADSGNPPAQPASPLATAPDDPSEHHGIATNCRAEIKTLCRGVLPGGGRIKQCVEENESKLSPACQSAVHERLEKEGSKKP